MLNMKLPVKLVAKETEVSWIRMSYLKGQAVILARFSIMNTTPRDEVVRLRPCVNRVGFVYYKCMLQMVSSAVVKRSDVLSVL